MAQQELPHTISRGCGEELGRRLNGARFSKSQALSAGKLRVTGFCWAAARPTSCPSRSAPI
jgi:hypothetical protein